MEHIEERSAPSGTGGEAGAASPVEAARSCLTRSSVCLMSPASVREHLGADDEAWARFAAHWDELGEDRYAAERGTRRLRRYGQFALTPATGELERLPHTPFVQPEDTNPLYETVDRDFEPLTDTFAADPLLRPLFDLLAQAAAALDDAGRWIVKVHPFRVVATAGDEGNPTPEGRHRDGVTLVSSLLVNRENAVGGQSCVYTLDGRELLCTTLHRPGSLLMSDDRDSLHCVSPIRPMDITAPAYRDVLVTTLTAA
ncbi:2OG-Fe dioxygenase family protein [Streptomyces rimosus]|uniref:2OG-Fe dioxygenase family protein n=1 Tax=Streptomyces rimosus TaxID=1927 RepID=UPI00099F103C|nr:2OG-Fe dioxygenase family protein [Streptomyces rimosus]